MINKQTKRWVVIVIVMAILLLTNVAIGLLCSIDNTIQAGLQRGVFKVGTDLQVGDYIANFGEFNGHSLKWRVIGQDEQGNKLIRTDRALANVDGSTFKIKFDDTSVGANAQGYSGNVAPAGYFNQQVIRNNNNQNWRRTRGTNFWEQSSIRAWLNDTFYQALGNYKDNIISKQQNQILWWGDGRVNGSAYGSPNIGGELEVEVNTKVDTTADMYVNLINGKATNSGVANPIRGKNPRGTTRHRFQRGYLQNVQNYNTDAFQYDIDDKVTLGNIPQITAIANNEYGEVLRNENGHLYSTVLRPDYVRDTEYRDNDSGKVNYWTRDPMGQVATAYFGDEWAANGARFGSSARLFTGDDMYNQSITGEMVNTEQAIAPTVWLDANKTFSNKYDASNNPGERRPYFVYTDVESVVTSGADYSATPLVDAKYLEQVDQDVTTQINKIYQDHFNFIDDGIVDYEYNGIGAFPRGLQFTVSEPNASDGQVSASVKGAVSLINLADPTMNDVRFTFQVKATGRLSGKQVVAQFSIEAHKGDPSAKGMYAVTDSDNNILYNGNLFGTPDQIRYTNRMASPYYKAIVNGESVNNSLASQGVGVYGDTLANHPLPAVERGIGWTWDEDESTDLGPANVASSDSDIVANNVDTERNAKHSATYRDYNNDLKTINRTVDFSVEQARPSTGTPTHFAQSTVQETWSHVRATLQTYTNATQGGAEAERGEWLLGSKYADGGSIGLDSNNSTKEPEVQFVPNSNNYGTLKTNMVVTIAVAEDFTITIENIEDIKADLTGLRYQDNVFIPIWFNAVNKDDSTTTYRVKATALRSSSNNMLGLMIDSSANAIRGQLLDVGTITVSFVPTVFTKELNEIKLGTFTIGKMLLTEDVPTPQAGAIKATYGQKLRQVNIGDRRFTWNNPNDTVGNASTAQEDENGNIVTDYRTHKATYEIDSRIETAVVDIEIFVDKAVSAAPVAPNIKDVEFVSGMTLGEVELPAGWRWMTPQVNILGVGDQEFIAIYNSDTNNYYDSQAVVVPFQVVPAAGAGGLSMGAIVGIIAAVVVVLAAAAIAFVLINKRTQTNTKVGSRGNRF